MPPRDYYKATRSPRQSGGTPKPGTGASGPPGRNYPVSKPTPFVDKRVTKSVSTSDVATGKFTGGTQRGTPKPEPDKTFIKKVVTPTDTSGDTGREKAIKKYATTGLKSLGEHRKKEVEKILSSGQPDIEKRKEIKKRNLRGAIPGLMKDVTKDKKLFVPPSESPWPSQRGTWSERITSTFMPLVNRMIYDANNIWGKNNYQSDAMRHLMYTTIYPVQAAGHETLDSRYMYAGWNPRSWEKNTQDMHNNALREEVLQRARKLGGTSYENIRTAAFEMVAEQEERTAQGLEPLTTLPITDLEHQKKLYPNLERKTYTKNLMEPIKSVEFGKWATKASLQGYVEAAKYATNQLMNWGKQWL